MEILIDAGSIIKNCFHDSINSIVNIAIEAMPEIVSPLTNDGLISLAVAIFIIDKSNKKESNTITKFEILYI